MGHRNSNSPALLAVAVMLLAGRTATASERGYFLGSVQPTFQTAGDVIASDQPRWSRDLLRAQAWVEQPDDLGQTQIDLVMPSGFAQPLLTDAAPGTLRYWDPQTHTASVRPIDTDQTVQSVSANYALFGSMATPIVGVRRSSADGWLLESDQVTRTYDVELTIPTGALADEAMDFRMTILNSESHMPTGLAWDLGANATWTDRPELFHVSAGLVTLQPGVDRAALGGTFSFSLEATLYRSNSLSQAQVGALQFKPYVGVETFRTVASQIVHSSTLNATLAGGNQASVTAEVDEFRNFSATPAMPMVELAPVAASGALNITEASLLLSRVEGLLGTTYYQASAELALTNAATIELTTPDGRAYELLNSGSGDQASVQIEAATAEALGDLGFTHGQYTFAVTDSAGTVHQIPVTLDGDYFDADPQFTPPHTTDDPTPTLSWQAPPDPANAVSIAVWSQQVRQEESVLESDAPLTTLLNFTPDAALAEGFYQTELAFGDVDTTATSGVEIVTGYQYLVREYFNVVDPVLTGDANGDGQVDGNDLIAVEENFGLTGAPGIAGDANRDGQVDGNDLIAVEENFGATLGAASVPEPGAVAMFAVLSGCLRRRRGWGG